MNGNSVAVYLCPSLCKIPSFSGGGGLQKGNLMRGSVELERIPGIPKLAWRFTKLYLLHEKSRDRHTSMTWQGLNEKSKRLLLVISGDWLYVGLSRRVETKYICWVLAPISKQMIITDVVDLGARTRSIRERMWIMDFWFLRKLDPVSKDSSGLDQTKWNEEISFHFGQIWFLISFIVKIGIQFWFLFGKTLFDCKWESSPARMIEMPFPFSAQQSFISQRRAA